jgi:hypothetical protein
MPHIPQMANRFEVARLSPQKRSSTKVLCYIKWCNIYTKNRTHSSPTNKQPINHIIQPRRSSLGGERAGMAASLARRLTLEPRDESLNGELLGESTRGLTCTDGGCSGGNGCSRGSRSGRSRGLLSDRASRCNGGSRSSRSSAIGRLGRSSRSASRSSTEHSRAGDVVNNRSGVGVEDDTILISLVDGSTSHTFRRSGSITSNLNVQTLRVRLCTVERTSAVQSNDFVAEHVLASLEISGNSDGPCVVLPTRRSRSRWLGSWST